MDAIYTLSQLSSNAAHVRGQHVTGPVRVHGLNNDRYDNIRNEGDPVVEFFLRDGYLAVLAAPMQFGKTGIAQYVAYQLNQTCRYHSDNIFIVTGIGSVQWLHQTRQRMIPAFRGHVYHNAHMRIAADEAVRMIRKGGQTLMIIDEAHFGAGVNNMWPKFLAGIARELENRPVCMTEVHQVLRLRGVHLLLISATPDAVKENMAFLPENLPTRAFTVDFTKYPGYVSCKSYLEQGVVKETHRLLDQTDNNRPFLRQIVAKIYKMRQFKYHLIRLHEEDNEGLLREALMEDDDDPDFVEFRYMNASAKDFDPEELKQAPTKHVIVFLKDMLRVAKSIPIEHVGIVVERPVKKYNDSTVNQSLMGRCCGWDKGEHFKKIVVYTHIDSVKRYVQLVENGFDYSKVANATGYKIKTTATKMTTSTVATGPGFKKALDLPAVKEQAGKVISDEMHRRLTNTLSVRRGLVFRVFKMLMDNENLPLPKQEILNMTTRSTTDADGNTRSVSIGDFTTWNMKHYRYKILEKVGQEGYRLIPEMLERYKDVVLSAV
jgi:hypothetical protein